MKYAIVVISLVLSAWAQAGVQVLQAWIPELPPVAKQAAVFAELHSDEPVRISAMNSPVAEQVVWHDMMNHAGQLHMMARAPADWQLPAGKTVWASGQGHLMLVHLKQPLRVGDAVPITLTLANGQQLQINAQVRSSLRPAPEMSHHHHHE